MRYGPSSATRRKNVVFLNIEAVTSAGGMLTEVYVNDDEEPYVLDVDGRLDLSGFELHYSSISLQGKKGLIDNATGITKRKWAELLEILSSGSQAKLGTKENPLQVKDVQVFGSGGCLPSQCMITKICALAPITMLMPDIAVLILMWVDRNSKYVPHTYIIC